MSGLSDRLERDLREVAAGAQPSQSAWESILARLGDDAESEEALVLTPALNKSKRPVWLAVAAAALLVIIGSIAVLTRAGDDQSISTADFPPLTTTFVSPRNGFSVKYFDRGERTITPATQLWGFGKQADEFDVVETRLAAVFKGASTMLPSDGPCVGAGDKPVSCGSTDDRIDDHLSDVRSGGCDVPRSQQEEITIGGEPGRVAECPNHIEATVVFGGRLYLFTLSHDRSDARAVFDAFVATIDLTPGTAVDFPGLTDTFVSPSYGYSFGYFDRGGLRPATARWDPGNQPVDFDPETRFDAVETGLDAYFEGASTPIPDGVPIDGWVDQYVTPPAAGGCDVPRSQQVEITIDGQSGRIAQCSNHMEATVVAGGRLYLFILYRFERDARAVFDRWIATIDLTPETATVP